jgi:hypothetical protein
MKALSRAASKGPMESRSPDSWLAFPILSPFDFAPVLGIEATSTSAAAVTMTDSEGAHFDWSACPPDRTLDAAGDP